jgi:hypothetical protein
MGPGSDPVHDQNAKQPQNSRLGFLAGMTDEEASGLDGKWSGLNTTSVFK